MDARRESPGSKPTHNNLFDIAVYIVCNTLHVVLYTRILRKTIRPLLLCIAGLHELRFLYLVRQEWLCPCRQSYVCIWWLPQIETWAYMELVGVTKDLHGVHASCEH